MAHEINAIDMQFGLEMAWHNLTKIVPAIVRDTVPACEREPLYCPDGNGGFRPYCTEGKPWFSVRFSDGFQAPEPVRESYRLFTIQEAFDSFQRILAGSRFTISSAGLLANRSKWFLTADLDELKDVTGEFKFHLTFLGSLDRKISPSIYQSGIRVVCANTFKATQASGEALFSAKARSGSFDAKLAAGEQLLENAVGMNKIFLATVEKMKNQKASVDDARQVYAGFLSRDCGMSFETTETAKGKARENRAANMVSELVTSFQRGKGNAGETRADVWNGLTERLTHGFEGSTKDKQSQIEFSDFGLGAERKARFFEIAKDETEW
jgi:hypothetical protein